MIFAFECKNCGREKDSDNNIPSPCQCGGTYSRRYSFSVSRGFTPHYNHSVGKYVNNYQEFKDELSRASESASERLGIEHNFQPIDGTDKSAIGVTDEGMDETRRRHSNAIQK